MRTNLLLVIVLTGCGPDPAHVLEGGSGGGTSGYAGIDESTSTGSGTSESTGSSDESTGHRAPIPDVPPPETPSCDEECLAAGWFCTEAVDACSGALVDCETVPEPGCVHDCTCEN